MNLNFHPLEKTISVMYIDDDEEDIALFQEALVDIGSPISFQSFSNGFDALNYLEQAITLPDYLFLDVNMPRMSGKEILIHLKKDSKLKSIPVILFTTSNFEHEVKAFFREGASGFIHKGITLAQIRDDIAGALKLNKSSGN
ncbi:MAG: response regulator [Azospira oryzae]|nr:MAG: response regulator [Azospira oryzae]